MSRRYYLTTALGLPLEKRRCVFLGPENDCLVYENRPTTCRKYFVASDPGVCAEPDGRPLILGDLDIELMASGFADLDQNQDPLPKAVLRELLKMKPREREIGI